MTQEEKQWLEKNKREIERLRALLPESKFEIFVNRCLDFVREYPDLDTGGDWSLVREIVFTEMALDEYKVNTLSLTPSDIDAMTKLQKQLESMVKSLGANRKSRRRERTQVAKIVLDMSKIAAAKQKAEEDRKTLFSLIEKSRSLMGQADKMLEEVGLGEGDNSGSDGDDKGEAIETDRERGNG